MHLDATAIDFGGGPADGGIATASRDFAPVGDGYRLTVGNGLIAFTVDRLRRSSGELGGELDVVCAVPGAMTTDDRGSLLTANFNLSSLRARQDRAKALKERSQLGADWFGLLEEFCQRVLAAERAGQPAVHLRDVDRPAPDASVDMDGLRILTRHPMIVFGDGGTGKSMIALHVAGELVRRGMRVLLADWELDGSDHRERLERLFGPEMPDVLYARCDRPLVAEVDRLRRIVSDQALDYILFDSVAFACDGPPESAEAAANYFRAVRSLGVGSLHVAHVNRSENGDQKPFGSAFWHNGARSTWFVSKSADDADAGTLTVGLFNRKANTGPIRPAVGLELHFGAERTDVRQVDLADVSDLASKVPTWQRIKSALRHGPMTLDALVGEVEGKRETVARTIRRSRQFTKLDDGRISLVERRCA